MTGASRLGPARGRAALPGQGTCVFFFLGGGGTGNKSPGAVSPSSAGPEGRKGKGMEGGSPTRAPGGSRHPGTLRPTFPGSSPQGGGGEAAAASGGVWFPAGLGGGRPRGPRRRGGKEGAGGCRCFLTPGGGAALGGLLGGDRSAARGPGPVRRAAGPRRPGKGNCPSP